MNTMFQNWAILGLVAVAGAFGFTKGANATHPDLPEIYEHSGGVDLINMNWNPLQTSVYRIRHVAPEIVRIEVEILDAAQNVMDTRGKNFPLKSLPYINVFGGIGRDHATNFSSVPSTMYGGRGHDHLVGGSSKDKLYGGPGNDTLEGFKGGDWLEGGEGDDNLRGQDGDDVMFGGHGLDLVEGGRGSDYLDGGLDEMADILMGDDREAAQEPDEYVIHVQGSYTESEVTVGFDLGAGDTVVIVKHK